MIKTFQIEYVRAVLNYLLKKNRLSDDYFDDDDIAIFSFYEHLATDEEINRYKEFYTQLIYEQNRQDTIGIGVLSITDSPNIINTKQKFISPFEWGSIIRCNLANRDKMLETLYYLISQAKGKCFDVAQFDNGKLYVVGTIAQANGVNYVDSGDYVGTISTTLADLLNGIVMPKKTWVDGDYIYATNNNVLCEYVYEDGAWVLNDDSDIPTHTSFEKLCIDLSFDDIKCSQSFVLNADEYCEISFGGSATLTNQNILLGNQLVKLLISKYRIAGETDYYFNAYNYYELDPLELPSGSNLNGIDLLLKSNNQKQTTHNESISLVLNYTFLLDLDIDIIRQWFNYGRYGITEYGDNGFTQNTITPNVEYIINEQYSSWGNIRIYSFLAKLAENVSIENSESDVLTIKLMFQIIGEQ